MNIKPINDKVVVEMLESEETTKSGIVLPGTAKEKTQMAVVKAVSEDQPSDEKDKQPIVQIKVGDKVIVEKYVGTQVKLDNKELTIVSKSNILAIVED